MSRESRDARHKTAQAPTRYIGHSVVKVALHHAVTVPDHVPTGLLRHHAGGSTSIPFTLLHDRREGENVPMSRYLTPERAVILDSIAIAPELDSRNIASSAIGAGYRAQRVAISGIARTISAVLKGGDSR